MLGQVRSRIHHPPDRRRFGVTLAFPSHEYHDFFLLLMYQLGCDDYITAFDEYHEARVASHVDEFDTLDAMVSQMTWMALVDMMHNFLFLFTVPDYILAPLASRERLWLQRFSSFTIDRHAMFAFPIAFDNLRLVVYVRYNNCIQLSEQR